MNYSTAVFLINKETRAVACIYELDSDAKPAPRTIFKTLDPDISVGDFVIVPTGTRHGMTVCKVVEVDVEIDFDSPTLMNWIVGVIDRAPYEKLLRIEQDAITKIKSAEARKKREELAAALFKDQAETLKELEIATVNTSLAPPPAT